MRIGLVLILLVVMIIIPIKALDEAPISSNSLKTLTSVSIPKDDAYIYSVSYVNENLNSLCDVKNGISFQTDNQNTEYYNIYANLEYINSKKHEDMGNEVIALLEDPYTNLNSNLNYIGISSKYSKGAVYDINSAYAITNSNLNNLGHNTDRLRLYDSPYMSDDNNNCSEIIKNIIHSGKKSPKNYAIVVGINDYAEWRDLHTGVNDADAMAKILDTYGYEIIKLTDNTETKPTKKNILDDALEKIITKKNRGNVVFYFSGHGTTDYNGNYYLIPQDAKKEYSYYISKEELEGCISCVENLAIIVDACNSGGFDITENAQMVLLASSGDDEPSNEKWLSSQSVFTYNLCEAIEEESKLSDKVILQRCFDKAKIKTSEWSKQRFLSQTPKMVDKSRDGLYYLN